MLGITALDRERPAEALPHLRRAETLVEERYGEAHADIAKVRVFVAVALARLGEREPAFDLLREETPRTRGGMRPHALFELAKLRWHVPAQRRRAIAEAEEAAALLRERETRSAKKKGHAIETWLAERRRRLR
jgi:hypothetical protein